ncbi:hypothetical protein GCM10011609_27780 [Lentzea pudingi]|uniref:Nucleotidyltransferase family protein n=1 Tax=Lentzea pudingi TaxID=1789439 RepID=A0ABQ2HTB2_9PSEU|nr:nucleotidyltransferase family protein [Lentzea pudingi]GGM89372.1 hypothetical protein GCM10011609_27780 [Lentzea pudingi]
MTEPSWSPEIELALLLSTPSLDDGGRNRVRELVGSHLDWNQVLGILTLHRTAGVAWRNVLDLGFEGMKSFRPEYVLRSLELTHKAQTMYGIDQLTHTTRLMRAFDRDGIRCAVLKGAAVARMGYRDPGMRLFGDNDILFHRSDLAGVAKIMKEFGYQQGWWDVPNETIIPAKRSEILLHSVHAHETFPYIKVIPDALIAGSHTADVHFSVDLLTNNNTDDIVDELLSRRIEIEGLDGSPLWTLHQDDMFAFVSVHYEREATHISEVDTTKDLLLYKLIDLLGMLSNPALPIDLTAVVKRAREVNMARELCFALHHLDVMFPGRVPQDVLDALAPDASDIDEVRDHKGPVHTWRSSLRERFFNTRRQLEIAGIGDPA